jgi:hypothetical protein
MDQPTLNQWSKVDGITRGPSFRQKFGDSSQRTRLCMSCRRCEGPFPWNSGRKLRTREINLLIPLYKICRLHLFIRQEFVINDSFIIKETQHCPHSRFRHSDFLSPSLNLSRHSNTFLLDTKKHSSPHALLNISRVSLAVFYSFTQNVIAVLCSILKLSTQRKKELHSNNCNPHMQRPNELKLAHHVNKCSLQLVPHIPDRWH